MGTWFEFTAVIDGPPEKLEAIEQAIARDDLLKIVETEAYRNTVGNLHVFSTGYCSYETASEIETFFELLVNVHDVDIHYWDEVDGDESSNWFKGPKAAERASTHALNEIRRHLPNLTDADRQTLIKEILDGSKV